MGQHFKTIGLIGKADHDATMETVVSLYNFLVNKGYQPIVDKNVASYISDHNCLVMETIELGKASDLVIVVGGDGNMLGAARTLSQYDVAVIGVNRGNLGFLTDLNPDDYQDSLSEVLDGTYKTEFRFLLDVSVYRDGVLKASNCAMNEVVLHADKVAHMIEFEAFIDESFVFHQRSDGLIVCTPTGSTAYSLSGGGPIVHPNLNAIALVPMFPHTLTSRPLVVDADSEVKIIVSKDKNSLLQISCDSHIMLSVMPGDKIVIKKHHLALRMVHPTNHDYYSVLRKKLHWGKQNY